VDKATHQLLHCITTPLRTLEIRYPVLKSGHHHSKSSRIPNHSGYFNYYPIQLRLLSLVMVLGSNCILYLVDWILLDKNVDLYSFMQCILKCITNEVFCMFQWLSNRLNNTRSSILTLTSCIRNIDCYGILCDCWASAPQVIFMLVATVPYKFRLPYVFILKTLDKLNIIIDCWNRSSANLYFTWYSRLIVCMTLYGPIMK